MNTPLMERKPMATGPHEIVTNPRILPGNTDHARRESPSSGAICYRPRDKQDVLRDRSSLVAPLQAALGEVHTRREVAQYLGISRSMVRVIEVHALHKIACRLKHLALSLP
jgi:hypothetical protein